jgi:hypothetical protein
MGPVFSSSPDQLVTAKAALYLGPYSFGDKKWDSQQIGRFNPQALHTVLRRAARRYPDPESSPSRRPSPH